MKFCFQAAILLISAFAPLTTWGTETLPIVIKDSLSPDRRKDIIITEDDENAGIAAGTAKVRDVQTGKILGSFAWSGFGLHPTTECFKVLWRPDSRCLAVNWEQTRGFVACAVYAQSGDGWQQVKLPDLGKRSIKLARAVGKTHVAVDENWGGKGHETTLAWLPNHCLKIETDYQGIDTLDAEGEWQQRFWFAFEIGEITGNSQPRAILRDARLAPLSTYHQPE